LVWTACEARPANSVAAAWNKSEGEFRMRISGGRIMQIDLIDFDIVQPRCRFERSNVVIPSACVWREGSAFRGSKQTADSSLRSE
jgi:hypothetical protein